MCSQKITALSTMLSIVPLSPCLLDTVALSGKKVDNHVQCLWDGSTWNNQGLLSSTSELAALLEGEPDGGIHNWRHPELAVSRIGGTHD